MTVPYFQARLEESLLNTSNPKSIDKKAGSWWKKEN
jgi:hypothetical protein